MKTRHYMVIALLIVFVTGFAQNSTITLTFTAINDIAYIQLDSIKIMNITKMCDTVLLFPDTTLTMDFPVSISKQTVENKGFNVEQNFPNPVIESASILIYIPKNDNVAFNIFDINGKQVKSKEMNLSMGCNEITFIPGIQSFYMFSATWHGITKRIKINAIPSVSVNHCDFFLEGLKNENVFMKAILRSQGFVYEWGDSLLLIGYQDDLASGNINAPITNKLYIFQFASNIPCPGSPTVSYEGQIYNTIQIYNQCWMKENLNVGKMILGNKNMTNNDTIEKYCYKNNVDSCTKYGGLYKWDEVMQYSVQQGIRGICPEGWHIPTDEEWKILEGVADTQYGIGDPIWDTQGFRGYDAGTNLKSISGWVYGLIGYDIFGFSGLPGGVYEDGFFDLIGEDGNWWTSTKSSSNSAFRRYLFSISQQISRFDSYKDYGFSLRCLRDY